MEAQEIDLVDVSRRAEERIAALKDDNILTRQMVTTCEFMRAYAQPVTREYAYPSYYDAVLELGTYKFADQYYRSDDVPDGEPQSCFANAAELALAHPDKYTYVEGYACTQQTGVCMAHAWVEDEQGRIIDNTWSILESAPNHAGSHYYGIKFSAEYLALRAIRGNSFAGLLGEDWSHLDHMKNGMILENGIVVGERDA